LLIASIETAGSVTTIDRLAFLITIRSVATPFDEKSELCALSPETAFSITGAADGGATARSCLTPSDELVELAGINAAQDASRDIMMAIANKAFFIFMAFSFL
jgi:hypothetical protein